MTHKIGKAAQSVAAMGTEILAISPKGGPASIEGYYDEAFAVPGLLREIRNGEVLGMDGYIIACFDDPGLDTARTGCRLSQLAAGELRALHHHFELSSCNIDVKRH